MTVSGPCDQAARAARSATTDRLRRAAGFHGSCRGKGCSCPCHRPPAPRDLRAELAAERAARLAAAGVDPIPPTRGTADRCRRDHLRTNTNTGSRGECLDCRRQRAGTP